MKYTELPRKERNRIRYYRQQTRLKDERARKRRTRPSDVCPPQYTDGISSKGKPQSEYHFTSHI